MAMIRFGPLAKGSSPLSTTASPVQPQPQPPLTPAQMRFQQAATQARGVVNATQAARQAAQQTPPQQQPQAPPQQQQPQQVQSTQDPLNTLKGMSDSQLAQFYQQSKTAKLPNHLGDVDDQTQKFAYQLGLNDKPGVLDQASFQQFLSDNNIPNSQILARDVDSGMLITSAGGRTTLTGKDIADMLKYGKLNYIGGKHGGQRFGAGTYFDMNGGVSTGYGYGNSTVTIRAVLNPATAKVIKDTDLAKQARAFDKAHPQFAKATGGYNTSWSNNNMSIYAMVLGYNAIAQGSGGKYHNVIDRRALVIEQ